MTQPSFFRGLVFAAFAVALLPSCGPSGGSMGTSEVIGTPQPHADGTYFIVEANGGGLASDVSLLSVSWGRLVEQVFDSSGSLVHRDLVIGQDIESDGSDYQVATNPISQTTSLTILHAFGSPGYEEAFSSLFASMDDLLAKSLLATELPPYSMVPRNSVMVVRFSDLIDPLTVTTDNLRVLSGYGPTSPFSARIQPDVNFGASIDGSFYSTRILIDPVVTALESQAFGLPVNGLGLPGAVNTAMPNLALRIPTILDFAVGQFGRLENLSGHAISMASSGPVDPSSSTGDIVRALRTGGASDTVQDPHNGFLPDAHAPMVVGSQSVQITNVAVDFSQPAGSFLVDLTYANKSCAAAPKVGDILTQPGVFVEVTAIGTAPIGGSVTGVKVRVLGPESGAPFPAGGTYETTWHPNGPVAPDCFVQFDPPAGVGTNLSVDPTASVIMRFSEPMDPASISVFDSYVVSREDRPLQLLQSDMWVIGEVFPSPDLKQFRFTPSVPMQHVHGVAEDFFVQLFEEEGVIDLGGNGLDEDFPSVPFFLDSTAAAVDSSHKAMRFGKWFDEPLGGVIVDDDGNGLADLRGQFVYNPIAGTISPRPVDRFSQTIDRNVGVPGWMTPSAEAIQNPGFLLGTFQEPLNPLGCKMMTLWRYFDMGLDVVDEAYVNIDVEHVNWAPIGSKVLSEYYPDFSISLATSNRTPDQTWNAPPAVLSFPDSGFRTTTFDENILADPENELTSVHNREEGYFIDPIEKFKSDSQTFMFPYPMNKYRQPEDFLYWTYRDTAITAVGGSDPLIGLEPPILYDVSYDMTATPPTPIGLGAASYVTDLAGLPPVVNNQICPGEVVPSFGLPILSEFRCYSSDQAIGINRLDTSLAMHPAWATGGLTGQVLGTNKPYMRIFSAGGEDTSGKPVYKDPDLELAPTGGLNYEVLVAPLGVATPAADNVFYMGQLDFVIRVSRVHTNWHEVVIATPTYVQPVMEPRPEVQPAGTSIELHYRGATLVAAGDALKDAAKLNMYGNLPASGDPVIFGDPALDNAPVTFDGTLGAQWTSDISDLDGLRFYQVRITFVNNAAAGTFAELSGLGFAYERL